MAPEIRRGLSAVQPCRIGRTVTPPKKKEKARRTLFSQCYEFFHEAVVRRQARLAPTPPPRPRRACRLFMGGPFYRITLLSSQQFLFSAALTADSRVAASHRRAAKTTCHAFKGPVVLYIYMHIYVHIYSHTHTHNYFILASK